MKKAAGLAALLALAVFLLPKAHASVDKTYEQLKLIVDILDYIKENYVEEVQSKDLIYGAARGMVGTLDPFSQFMDPELHKDVKTETEGQFGGLGIRIGMREEWLTVITPLPGTPAYKVGVLPQDRIVKIEDESTKGLGLSDAVKKLRGKPGTPVKLQVARNLAAEDKPEWTMKDFSIVREVIKIQSVQSRMLQDKTGYVRIIEFSAQTTEETGAALEKLKKAGATSMVLDLRNNPGGLLTAAVDVASYFLGDSKLIVYTQGRRTENKQEFRSSSKAQYGGIPMVVLVNGGSASGSEIVTGALQDHKRAVIVGEKTFGKASVQSVIPLPDGSGLRLTVAKYYTPSGRGIMRDEKKGTGGIMPDILVPVTRETEAKLQQQADEVYEPGRDPKSVIKKESQVQDSALERALELLRAREVLSHLNVTDG
ncbi:MAG: S41 family peptidase [Elusimicrobia bacterium]|nr:S41 family peptidase [Elusimicrobiota bacterium]